MGNPKGQEEQTGPEASPMNPHPHRLAQENNTQARCNRWCRPHWPRNSAWARIKLCSKPLLSSSSSLPGRGIPSAISILMSVVHTLLCMCNAQCEKQFVSRRTPIMLLESVSKSPRICQSSKYFCRGLRLKKVCCCDSVCVCALCVFPVLELTHKRNDDSDNDEFCACLVC